MVFERDKNLPYGPNRPTFTMKHPAPYNTINSIINNNTVGDERDFIVFSELGKNEWHHNITVEPGKKYGIQIYVHNNAAANRNLIAEDVKVLIEFPYDTTGRYFKFRSEISSSNCTPNLIWDEGIVVANEDVRLQYVAGRARCTNRYNYGPEAVQLNNGEFLSDDIVTTGVLIGYEKMDGRLPGCTNYSAYIDIVFEVKKL